MKAADKQAIKQELYKKRRGKCEYCEKQVSYQDATLDHWHPKAAGGGNTKANFRLACRECNEAKASMTPWQWITRGAHQTKCTGTPRNA